MNSEKTKDTKIMRKIKCPHCGHLQYPFYEKDAVCRGVYFLCKNPTCRKQFELRL